MDENVDIEIQEEGENQPSAVQLPMNFLTFGEIENDDVKVYIKQDVFKALEAYALKDVEHERGTILLGRYSEEMGKTHVVISDYIEAKYTDASASTLTFTHETWEYVHKEHDEKYPDEKIVGWQHTHPSYGIFLSNYDLFIHENFFNLPFQLAYVIDPVQNLRGFFQWKNGKIEKLKGYYVYDEIGKPIKISQAKPEKEKTGKKKISWLPIVTTAVALVLVVACLFMISSLRGQLQEQQEKQSELETVISRQEEELYQIQSGMEVEDADGETVSITDLQAVISAQQQTIDELSTAVEELKNGNDDEYIVYTVKAGDTLSRICYTLGIDYGANRSEILRLNNITNENVIVGGQTIFFPKTMQVNEDE